MGGKDHLHSFLASALEEGEWLSFRPRSLYARERIKEVAEWAPELVWTFRRRRDVIFLKLKAKYCYEKQQNQLGKVKVSHNRPRWFKGFRVG